MKPENLEIINKSFDVQAADFESRSLNFSKEDYLKYTLESVEPKNTDTFLEVAAGTCVCARSFAPMIKNAVCIDATPAMLQVGKDEADKKHLDNMIFVKGYAEELPFLDDSFDIVFSRLAFHHFTNVDKAFSEMVRVLKPGGKLVLIDMEATQEELRATEDEIERLRDMSHIRNLSKEEIDNLFIENGLTIEKSEVKEIEQYLTKWLELTKTPEDIQKDITKRMQKDLQGGVKTGFSPYYKNGEICFKQRWLLTLGYKSNKK